MSKHEKALVFGGAGFLGSAFVDSLASAGFSITVVDIREAKTQNPVHTVIADVTSGVKNIGIDLDDYDYVCNFIAQADIAESLNRVRHTFEANLLFCIDLLEALRASSRRPKFVFASSAYAQSANGAFYGISKWAAERVIQQYQSIHGIDFLIFRYGTVYGPGANVHNTVHRVVDEALKHKRISFSGSGEEKRDFLHVRDAGELSVSLLQQKKFNQIFHLAGTQQFSYAELGKLVSEVVGQPCELRFSGQSNGVHFSMTPYSLVRLDCKKVVPSEFTDIGQGIMELIEFLESGPK